MAQAPRQSDLARKVTGELLSPDHDVSMSANLMRAEIDQQVATARRWPRNITTVKQRIEELATLDEETAAECLYELPRRSEDGKPIRGESIRFAEIVLQAYGNCRAYARVTDVGPKSLEVTGYFMDLEANVATAKAVTVRITKKNGERYGDDMITVASGAGVSKALRNAILTGVPKGIWKPASDKAQAVARGTAATLTKRRSEALVALKELGAAPKDVFEILGVKSEADITLDHMLALRGLYTALKTDETTVQAELAAVREARAPAPPKENLGKGAAGAKEGFSAAHVEKETNGAGKKPPAAATPTPPHDAETGEVIEGSARVVEERTAAAEPEDEQDEDERSEGDVAPADEDEEQLEAETPFAGFWAALAEAQEARAITDALPAVYGSDDFNELEPDEQAEFRAKVFTFAQTLPDCPDVAASPTFFRLWIDTQEGPDGADAIEGTLRALEASDAWGRMKDPAKERVRAAAKSRADLQRGRR